MSCERYDLALEVAPREAVKLLYISRSRFGGDWHSTPHTHHCAELFYCVHGCGQFNIEGTLYSVGQDDMIIINPLVEHTELSLNANPLEYVVMGVDGIDFLFGKGNERFAKMNCGSSREEMMFLFRSLLREVDNRGEGCETICQDLLEVLLLWLVRGTSFAVRPNAGQAHSKECAAARRYLDEHYTENLNLDTLAEIIHVNKFYLSHEFSREYKISPINYLIRKRIEESKALLTSTDHSIAEISGILGFSSPSYFSQTFRRLSGSTPAQYRRSAK